VLLEKLINNWKYDEFLEFPEWVNFEKQKVTKKLRGLSPQARTVPTD
jgi:hypothetical protein